MRQLFKILVAMSIIAFAASMLAVSCGKTADPNNNTNTNSGGDGGSGSGGGGGGSGGGSGGNGGSGNVVKDACLDTTTPNNGEIEIIGVNSHLAKIQNGTNILIKLSAFPTTSTFVDELNSFRDATTALQARQLTNAFEIINNKAKEGIVLVGKGNVANICDVNTLAVGGFTGVNKDDDDGIHIIQRATASPNGVLRAGLNFMSVFASIDTPADNLANTEPFSFSITRNGGVGFEAQPIFWCTATAPAITAAVAATDKLAGSQKATCYFAGRGYSFGGGAGTGGTVVRNDWFSHTKPFKHEIQVAIAAIRTDDKTIADLMPGADDAAKLANFNDGINKDEMKAIIEAYGRIPFKKFNIKIVKDADF